MHEGAAAAAARLDCLSPHDHRHVLEEDLGVEGLGQRVGRDAVGAEVLDDDLVSLLHRVDVHVADGDMLCPRVERLVGRQCSRALGRILCGAGQAGTP